MRTPTTEVTLQRAESFPLPLSVEDNTEGTVGVGRAKIKLLRHSNSNDISNENKRRRIDALTPLFVHRLVFYQLTTMYRFLTILVAISTIPLANGFVPIPQMPNLPSLKEQFESFSLGVFTMDNAPPATTSSSVESPVSSMNAKPSLLDDMKDKFAAVMAQQNPAQFFESVIGGEFFKEERAEVVLGVQVFSVLLVHIVTGGLPVIGDAVNILCGPILMALGSAICTQAFLDKDSPKTDGIYSHVRHPIFAGILAIMGGYSIITSSAPRLVMTAALSYALDQFTDDKETKLGKQTKGKFVP